MPRRSDRESISAEEPMGPVVDRIDHPPRSIPRVVGVSDGAVEEGILDAVVEEADEACDHVVGLDILGRNVAACVDQRTREEQVVAGVVISGCRRLNRTCKS